MFTPKIMNTTSIVRAFFVMALSTLIFIACKKTDEKIKINPIVKQGIPIMDIDSNIYPTVQIGQQIWMQENLKTTRFANGDSVYGIWIYDFDTVAVDTYGMLYSWQTAVDTCSVCPHGWHVPSQHEFAILVEYLGGVKLAGGYLKERGLDHWEGPNNGANNESKWSGIGAGYFSSVSMLYINRKKIGYWWSRTSNSPEKGFLITLDKMSMDVGNTNSPKDFGYSIRCLNDSLDLTITN